MMRGRGDQYSAAQVKEGPRRPIYSPFGESRSTMNTVWQEQLDKGAATNPRADYLISPEVLASRLEADGLKVLDATTHLRPTEDGGFASEPGFDDFLSEHIPGAQFADLQVPSRMLNPPSVSRSLQPVSLLAVLAPWG